MSIPSSLHVSNLRVWVATFLLGFVVLLSGWLWRRFVVSQSLRLPPGPRPLPIVGNLLQLRKHPSMQDFANELKSKYGPIVTFWMGSKPVIIMSGPEIIQEAMIKHGAVLMGKVQLQSTSLIMRGHRKPPPSDGESERHRFIRKLLVSEVLGNRRVGGVRHMREQEVTILIDRLKKLLSRGSAADQSRGIVTNFRSLIRFTICNLMVGIVFGRRLTHEAYLPLDEVMVKRFLLATGKPRDFIPCASWLPDRKGMEVQLEMNKKISLILEPLIEERRQAMSMPRKPTDQPPSFVDILLGMKSGEIKSPIHNLDADVMILSMGILSAGTDASALNVEYCIANLINHPEIQEKLASEISTVVGSRVVSEEDIPRLPYLRAVVKEALRRHTPARLSPPHRALSATKLAGFDIPADALIMKHLEAVALSPNIWEDPLEFRPERFLNKRVDVTGTTEVTMIPFGMGRRICPGISVAFLHAEFILARLIQAFEWKPVTPGQLLDLSPGRGQTTPMKYPLAASLQERLPVS